MPDYLREGFLLRCWHFLWRPSARWPWLVFVLVGLAIGIAGSGVTAGALWFTSTNTFCMSCHEQNAVPEWKRSVHFVNAAGFTAGCADCHEPHNFIGMVLRKTAAVDEVWNQFLGTISTPEKFEAHRWELAQKEWTHLHADNSAECRDCHQLSQDERSRESLSQPDASHGTCQRPNLH